MNKLKNIRFGAKLAGGFGLILVLMAVVSTTVYTNIHNMLDSSKWVNHTHHVIRVAEGVLAAMINMETGQRGFVITGKKEYLDPLISGDKEFEKLIVEGQELTSDNLEQLSRWKEISELKKHWLEDVAEPEIEEREEITLSSETRAHFKEISTRTIGKQIFDEIRTTIASIENQLGNDLNAKYLVKKITLDLVNMETGQRGFLLTGKDESLQPYKSGADAFSKHLAELHFLSQNASIRQADLMALERLTNDWMNKAANPEIEARYEVNKHHDTIENLALMMEKGPGKELMDTIRRKISKIIDTEELLIAERGAEFESVSNLTINIAFIGTLIAILIGTGVAYLVTQGVVSPISQANNLMKEIANGDLTKRIPVHSKDEIGEMSGNFNLLAEKLQRAIGQITNSTTQLVSAAEELKAATEQTSDGVSSQQNETDKVASAINQMSASVEAVARSASQASSEAHKAESETRKGALVVQKTIKAIEDLAHEVSDSAKVIDELKADSENIGTVLDVIKGIAEQTNLLALNAAIEAARAGEQGRGFAVVADEVRTLAQRTQESTAQIETLVESLQNGAEHSVKVMEHSRSNAESTVAQAKLAGGSLVTITSAVEAILETNTHIASAAEQQSSVAHNINDSVCNMQGISEQTAIGARQTSRSSTALANLGRELRSTVDQFRI